MPTLELPKRFQQDPYNGDYRKILGLKEQDKLTKENIQSAFKTQILQYHPDKLRDSSVEPPLTREEATECTRAIFEIKSILLSGCQEVMREGLADEAKPANPTPVKSAADLSPGEQLKANLLAYMRSARFCEYSPGTGPDARGYWCLQPGGTNGIEIGRSKYSGNLAIATGLATVNYQVEVVNHVNGWNRPLTVYCKDTNPYRLVTDPKEIEKALSMMAESIPLETRDNAARVYGNHVRENLALQAEPAPAPKEVPAAESPPKAATDKLKAPPPPPQELPKSRRRGAAPSPEAKAKAELLEALKKNEFETALNIIEKDKSLVNTQFESYHSASPLSMVAAAGDYKTVKALIDLGANVNLADAQNNIPLSWSIIKGDGRKSEDYKNIALLLIEKGSDLTHKDKKGWGFASLLKHFNPQWKDVLAKIEKPEPQPRREPIPQREVPNAQPKPGRSPEGQGQPKPSAEAPEPPAQGHPLQGEAQEVTPEPPQPWAAKIDAQVQMISELPVVLDIDEETALNNLSAYLEEKGIVVNDPKTHEAISKKQGQISAALKLNGLLTGLEEENKGKSGEMAVAVSVLHADLKKASEQFFKAPSRENFGAYQSQCFAAIHNAEKVAKQHRGWGQIPLFFRGFVGVITIIPLLLPGKHRFSQIFFKDYETESTKKVQVFKDKLQGVQRELEQKESKTDEDLAPPSPPSK